VIRGKTRLPSRSSAAALPGGQKLLTETRSKSRRNHREDKICSLLGVSPAVFVLDLHHLQVRRCPISSPFRGVLGIGGRQINIPGQNLD